MRRPDDWEQRRYVFECAWHLCLGATVDEIADKTGRSRPTVYRALEHARDWDWLDDHPRMTMVPGEERDQLEQHMADFSKAEKVRDKFGSDARPSEVIVAPAPPAGPEEAAAVVVCRALRQSETYQEAVRDSREPDWETVGPGLVDEVLADEEVEDTAGMSRSTVEKLVEHHVHRPYTDREIESSRRVGRAAAARFCRALEEGHVATVGISWGYHVYRFVRSTAISFPPYGTPGPGRSSLAENARKVLAFPLIGSLGLDPLMDARGQGAATGAYGNCTRLADKLGAEAPVVITQPARIPSAFHEPGQLRQIWRYVQEDISISLIFGQGLADRRVTEDGHPIADPAEAFLETGDLGEAPDGCLAEADALITGIGACAADSRAPRLGLLSAGELADLAAWGACGDVSGRVFWDAQAPPSEANRDRIRATNARVIGPCLADFIRATARAREADDGSLGTMVLASGEVKAEAVRRLCHWRVPNILVVDSTLASCLAG